MANTTNVNIRMDSALKQQFDTFCETVGMSMTTAFCLFARRTVMEQKIPFEISADIPNTETRAAIAEVEEMKKHPENVKRYSSFSALLDEVTADA